MTAGGKRKGAGRPPLSPQDVPEAITIKAHPSAVARFKAWCAAKNLSHRELFEQMIKTVDTYSPEHHVLDRNPNGRLLSACVPGVVPPHC